MDQTTTVQVKKAPVGVEILAVLEYIAGVFFVLVGILAMFRGEAISRLLVYTHSGAAAYSATAGRPFLGIVLIVLGIIHFFLGSGLWQGEHWAYLWVVVVSILYILFGVVTYVQFGRVNILSEALNILVLIYLLASSSAKAYLA